MASAKELARQIRRADRGQLVTIYDHYRTLGVEHLRRLIVERDRVDLLATLVLDYEVLPLHLAMLQWQAAHRESLILAFRGAGKTTVCTVTKAIHLLIKDRDLRILIASKSKGNAESFLKEIKAHFEGNAKLAELFGSFYDPRSVAKWDNSEVEVLGRKRASKEASITCVGIESAVVSKHYDVVLSDDLVDEENSRTKYMRDKTRTWYYQTLEPTREPPDPAVPHRGEHHVLGTHYHFDDLYAHLRANELEGATLAIPAIDEKGRSAWASKFPVEWLEERKQRSGIIIFNAQFQVDTEAMKGEVFQYDDCQQIPAADVPDDLHVFMGADLAATEETRNDQFAIVVIGCEGKPRRGLDPESIYVLDYFAGRIRFSAQLEKIEELYEQWAPIRCGIEANAYQKTLYSELKHRQKGARYVPIFTSKDKLTRAWKLSAAFEGKRVFFKRNLHGPIIDQLVLFPNHRHDDLFDALDFAVATFKKRRRRKRTERKEPGLL